MAVLRGSCLCGGVKFEVTEPPDSLRYCHCESCKKLAGAPATVNGRVPSTAIRILEGEDLLQTFQPAEGSSKTFCLACGSNLFGGGWPDSPVSRRRRDWIRTRGRTSSSSPPPAGRSEADPRPRGCGLPWTARGRSRSPGRRRASCSFRSGSTGGCRAVPCLELHASAEAAAT